MEGEKTKLRNTTDIPDEQVREIIRLVRPSGISNFDVMVKNGRHYKGMAYWSGSGYHATNDPFITLHLAPEKDYLGHRKWTGDAFNGERWPVKVPKFPLMKGARGGYLPCLLLSRNEYLAYLLAHELRHLWQSNHKNGKVWGARGKFSERDADAYAIRMVRAYRRENDGHEIGEVLDKILS